MQALQDRAKKLLVDRRIQAAGVGVLQALAFPEADLAGAAWIAPGLLLVVSLGASGRAAFRLGWLAGLATWLISLHWLLFIPVKFFPILGWLLLGAYLAIYQGLWLALCRLVHPVGFKPSGGGFDEDYRRYSSVKGIHKAAWFFACAVLWVGLEMVRARLLTGFPWNLLGASQYRTLPLVQIVSVAGVYGISFLMVWCSVAFASVGLQYVKEPGRRRFVMMELAPPILVMAAAWFWGARAVWEKIDEQPIGELRIALIQPSIPQDLIWDESENGYRFRKLIELSRDALTNRPALLVWPEAAIPEMLRYDPTTFVAVTNLAVAHKVWMVVGSDDAEPAGGTEGPEKTAFFNSAFLISPRGDLVDRYSKRQLVIFGEYVPLEDWLPFLREFTPVKEGFTPGSAPGRFRFEVPKLGGGAAEPEPPGGNSQFAPTPATVEAAILICFEDVFPRLARDSVDRDTDFILNLTNDGWFKESAAQFQHAANAVFRAVETGKPLVRCTNNGRTCWADSAGRLRTMQEFFATPKSDIYAEGFKIVSLPMFAKGDSPLPFYHRHGDWLGWSCVVAGFALVTLSLANLFRKQNRAEKLGG